MNKDNRLECFMLQRYETSVTINSCLDYYLGRDGRRERERDERERVRERGRRDRMWGGDIFRQRERAYREMALRRKA
jgi:hypothetical protein